MKSDAEKRSHFREVQQAFRNAICAFSISELDGETREYALNTLATIAHEVEDGFQEIDRERERAKEQAVIKAWREGRVTIHE